jgi:hypothetical protein
VRVVGNVRVTVDNACVADTALILGLAGMASTLSLGLAAPWLQSRFKVDEQTRAFEHERTMRDEEELRRVLDEVMTRLDECQTAMHVVFGRHLRWGRKFGEDEEARSRLVELGEATQELRAVTGRLAVRLGVGHVLRLAAVEALNGALRFSAAVTEIAFMADQADLVALGAEIEQSQKEFSTARNEFIDLAVGFAGSRVPRNPALELGITDRTAPPEK